MTILMKINKLIPLITKLMTLLNKINLKPLINRKISILTKSLKRKKEKPAILLLNKLSKRKKIKKILRINKSKEKSAPSQRLKIKLMIQKVVSL